MSVPHQRQQPGPDVDGRAAQAEARSEDEPLLNDLSEEGRARQRAAVAAARGKARTAHSLVIVNTGNGKGKTTAALGLLLRAWGQGLRVIMLQFIKAQTGNWGEIKAAKKLGIEIIPLGDGFTWMSNDIEHDRALAQECWARCRDVLASGSYDLVVLDEMTYCLTFGWLDSADVLDALRHRPSHTHVVITGRDAPSELTAFADLVSEIREVKHPFNAGVRAQKGIEF
ncbi:MAG: cob(I)yrinic acid a,c-diamide adenosyltransferase [Chloroflexota bacterium]